MEEKPNRGGHRKWRTDDALAKLPRPETYPDRRGSVPRELVVQRVAEVYGLLKRSLPFGKIKRDMAIKWSADCPDYPVKQRSVERYITEARAILSSEYKELGGENYWPCSVAWWADRLNDDSLDDKERVKARENLDDIMHKLSVKKIAITDTKGRDLTVEERRDRLLGILDTLRQRAGADEAGEAAGGGHSGPEMPAPTD